MNLTARNWFLSLIVVATLSGCTKLEFALRWADTFVLSYITDYFDLSSLQKTQSRSEFKKSLSDVQKNEFPQVAQKLNELANGFEKKDLKPEKIESLLKSAEPLFKKALSRFESLAQKIVSEQALKGYQTFDKEILEKYSKDIAKLTDPRQVEKENQKRLNYWLRETVEVLTPEQKKYIQEQMQQNPAPRLLQVESRKFVFEKFKVLRGNPAQRKEFIHQLMKDWTSVQDPNFLAARENYHKKVISWIIEVSRTLTETQRLKLVENLKKRASEFQRLSE